MLSGRSVRTKCLPAGVKVQPLGKRKPFSVGPAKRGLSSTSKEKKSAVSRQRTAARRNMNRLRDNAKAVRGGIHIVTREYEDSNSILVKTFGTSRSFRARHGLAILPRAGFRDISRYRYFFAQESAKE